jgi:predicted HTH domain antitoxin
MRNFETQIPDDVYATLEAQGFSQEQLAAESRRLLALRFFREHVLSLGQAARLAGMDYWAFTEFLSANNVPVVDLDEEELAAELSTVKRIAQQIEEGHE